MTTKKATADLITHQYVSADAHVLLAGGRWMPAARLRDADEVVVLEESEDQDDLRRSWGTRHLNLLQRVSARPARALTLDSGMRLQCSPERLVLTPTGNKRAADLQIGDEVAVMAHLQGDAAAPLSPEDAAVLAVLTMCWDAPEDRVEQLLLKEREILESGADDEIAHKRFLPTGPEPFRCHNRAIVNMVAGIAGARGWFFESIDGERFRLGPNQTVRPVVPDQRDEGYRPVVMDVLGYNDAKVQYVNPWSDLLADYKMRHLASLRTRVPGALVRSSTETMCRFIAVLFGANPELVIEEGHIAWPHRSVHVCQAVQHMLWRMGVYSDVERRAEDAVLHLRNAGPLTQFMRQVGVYGASQDCLDPLADVLPAEADRTEGMPRLDAVKAPFGWAKVTANSLVDAIDAYEIGIRGFGALVVEGLLSSQPRAT